MHPRRAGAKRQIDIGERDDGRDGKDIHESGNLLLGNGIGGTLRYCAAEITALVPYGSAARAFKGLVLAFGAVTFLSSAAPAAPVRLVALVTASPPDLDFPAPTASRRSWKRP